MNPLHFRNPVAFVANGIGDHLLALPTIRLLQAIFPNLKVLLVPGANELFFRGIDFKDTVFLPTHTNELNRKTPNAKLLDYSDIGLLGEQIGSCDLFFSLNTWYSETLYNLLDLLKPKETIGLHPEFSIPCPSQNNHMVDLYFNQGKLFAPAATVENYARPPLISFQERKLLNSLKNPLRKSGHKILVIHTDTKAQKCWDDTLFQSVVESFLDLNPEFLVLIVGLRHRIHISEMRNRNRVIDFCRLPLRLSFGIIGCSDLFLGIDSCMLHAADLFRIPSVGIFGPTDPQKWGVRFAPHKHLHDSLDVLRQETVLDALLSLTGA